MERRAKFGGSLLLSMILPDLYILFQKSETFKTDTQLHQIFFVCLLSEDSHFYALS